MALENPIVVGGGEMETNGAVIVDKSTEEI